MPRDASAALLAEALEALEALTDLASWSEARTALASLASLGEVTHLSDDELAVIVDAWRGHDPPCLGAPACEVSHRAHEHARFLLAAAAIGDRCDAHRKALRDIAVQAGAMIAANEGNHAVA